MASPTPHVANDPCAEGCKAPTHYHCYKWSVSGQQWFEVSKKDSLDQYSPDRPPIRTNDWLKKPQLLRKAASTPEQAVEWMLAEWAECCEKALNPVPAWANEARAARVMQQLRGNWWPTWSLYLKGGQYVVLATVGTDNPCH